MWIHRLPSPPLRPWIKALWACQETSPRPAGVTRERVLPTGASYVVFRLDHPLRLFNGIADPAGQLVAHAVVGGARSAFCVKDISQPLRSVGAELLPSAAQSLLGTPADELAGRHTPLFDLWGQEASIIRERLLEAGSLNWQLDLFEAVLLARLPKVRGLHPAVAQGLERLELGVGVRDVVAESGYSHRRFIELFRRAVGLPPKVFARVRRFQRAVNRAAAGGLSSWVDLALDEGYSDQSHFNREFRELAGISPGQYREAATLLPSHVPIRPT